MGDWELVLELSGGIYLARRTGPRRFARLGTLRLLGVAEGDGDPFEREIARASAAAHPLLCSIQDAGDVAGQRFVVTDYVEGGSLREIVSNEAALPPDVAVAILIDALTALDALHRSHDKRDRQLTHGAITKTSIVVGIDGRTRLSDVGLAWLARSGGDPLAASRYASPAVQRGSEPAVVDDVYAMGRILHEILGGPPPEVPSAVLPLLSSLDGRVSPALAGAIARATAPDPEQRFQSADAFAAALEASGPRATAREVGSFLESRHERALAERRAALAEWSKSRSAALGIRPPPRSRVLFVRARRRIRKHQKLARAVAVLGLALLGAALGLTVWRLGHAPASPALDAAAADSPDAPADDAPAPPAEAPSATAPGIDIEALPTVEDGEPPKPVRRPKRQTEELSNPYR